MPESIDLISLWLFGGDWRKVSFNDQHHRSFKMVATTPILLVSIDYLTNAWVNWLSTSRRDT
jgi:hypothetical protein